jgi:hypothetical protein
VVNDGIRESAAELPPPSAEVLAGHLAESHGVEVTGLSELDLGVFQVERAGGEPWVARVFPAERPLAEVEGDAAILRRLERVGFPAERCASPAPVSELDGQGVLVTGFVPGPRARMRVRSPISVRCSAGCTRAPPRVSGQAARGTAWSLRARRARR